MKSYKCPICNFDLWHPIARFKTSTLGLHADARYPGRCILVYNQGHIEDLADLHEPALQTFMQDLQKAARAIQKATGANRMNYCFLGNTVAHLHAHIIPRVWADDPVPKLPIWEHPDKQTWLPQDRIDELVASIRLALTEKKA